LLLLQVWLITSVTRKSQPHFTWRGILRLRYNQLAEEVSRILNFDFFIFNSALVEKLTTSGWGTGFLKTLTGGATGTNFGHDGATTVSFVADGDWVKVIDAVKTAAAAYTPYVTIQVFVNTFP
jgi:hypothetical protein